MNIEELKLILEMVQSVTGAAQNVAVWWFAYKSAQMLLVFAGLMTALWVVARIVRGIVRNQTFALKLRDYVCGDSAYGYISRQEEVQMLAVMKRGLEK